MCAKLGRELRRDALDATGASCRQHRVHIDAGPHRIAESLGADRQQRARAAMGDQRDPLAVWRRRLDDSGDVIAPIRRDASNERWHSHAVTALP